MPCVSMYVRLLSAAHDCCDSHIMPRTQVLKTQMMAWPVWLHRMLALALALSEVVTEIICQRRTCTGAIAPVLIKLMLMISCVICSSSHAISSLATLTQQQQADKHTSLMAVLHLHSLQVRQPCSTFLVSQCYASCCLGSCTNDRGLTADGWILNSSIRLNLLHTSSAF